MDGGWRREREPLAGAEDEEWVEYGRVRRKIFYDCFAESRTKQ